MKLKFLIPVIALGGVLVSCQNQQSKTNNQDSIMNADSQDHAMNDGMSNMQETTDMMVPMKKMMDNMHKMEKKGNADYDLAACMKEHHLGAIDMAGIELKSGSDAQLKIMAQKIINAQSKEIKDLDNLLDKYKDAPKDYDPSNADTGLGKAMMDNMMSMMNMPKAKETSTDHDFAMMMSKHHQEGVKMGNTILKFVKDPMFKSMTQKMVNDQTNEIKEFEKWLNDHK